MFENRRKEKQMAKANKVSDYSILDTWVRAFAICFSHLML